MLVACSLALVAYLFKKFSTALQVCIRQLAMVLQEPWQQVVVINSFHQSPSDIHLQYHHKSWSDLQYIRMSYRRHYHPHQFF